jgi:iron complex outermembrane receptor protein
VGALTGSIVRAQEPATGTITGAVVARETGQPIAGAVVTIQGTSVTAGTNAIGRFRIESAPVGRASLLVTAPGFLDMHVADVQVAPGAPSDFAVELELTPNFLERVQVTATKEPLTVGDVAAQTNLVERADIDLRGDQTLTQAISHVPGVVVSTQLGIFESVMLRGMPRGDPEFTNTLLLVDGVPQTLSNNGARVIALPINHASRVEIVRGPNSALYGRTAIGGSVNLRTADPAATPEYTVEFTGGELGMVKGSASASGPLKQWGGYYLSAGGERNGGYFEDKTTDDYSNDNKSVFAKVVLAPTSRTFASVSVHHVDSRNFTPTNEPIVDGELLHDIDPRFDRFTNFNIPGPNYNQRETRVTLNLNHQLTDRIRLVDVFGYRAVQHKFIEDGDFIGSPYDLVANTVSMYPFSQQMDEDIFYEEARLDVARPFGSWKSTLVAGGSYEWNNGKLFSDFIYNDPDLFGFTINYLTPVIPPKSEWQHDTENRVYHLGIAGIFGQYAVEPTPRLILTAGGRYDRQDLDNSRNGGATLEGVFEAFSPKVSATVKLAGLEGDGRPVVNVYGAYSQAFLPPRRASSLVPADVALDLRPEDIDNYEAGLKASLLDRRMELEAAIFRMNQSGVVLSTRQGPFFIPTNAGELDYKGVEAGVSFAVTPKTTAYVNASFYRNRFGDFVIESEDGDEDLTGNRLPMSPDYVVNWGGSYRPVSAVDIRADVKHQGGVQADRENTFTLEPFAIVDAAVSWTRGPLRVTLSGHNLLDEEYYWNSDGDTADPGRPRQVLLSTAVVFR